MAEEIKTNEKEKGLNSDFVKMIIIGVVVFIIAMGTSYLLFHSMIKGLIPSNNTAHNASIVGNLIKVEEFVTNISDPAGKRYVKLKVTLEVPSEPKTAAESVNQSLPIIRNCILEIVGSKSAADFDTHNWINLQGEIKTELNDRLGSGTISNVYFEDLIIQ